MRMTFVVCAVLASLAAAGCAADPSSGRSTLTYGEDAEQNYLRTLEVMRAGRCLEAEPAFRRIRREFPYSRFAALAELRAADCMLEQRKYAEAITAYRQFVRFRPAHAEVPYARFKIAEAHYRQIPDSWFLSPPAYERDQTKTRGALSKLRSFVVDHPEDERVAEARQMIERALRLLAEHELYVARFYRSRGAYRAVVNRCRVLLSTYEGSGLESQALLMMGRAHLELDQTEEAREAFETLVERFPDSDQAGRARSALSRL